METRTDTKPARRSWFALRLRTLLLVVAVFSIWFGFESNKARRVRLAIAEIEKRRGWIMYSDEWDMSAGGELPIRHGSSTPPPLQWLRGWIGTEYFAGISGVTVTTAGNDLAFLDLMPRLKSLSIEKSTVTDDGLAAIAGQSDLIYLWLDDTRISDAGLLHLRQMKRLKYLYIRNSLVTDAGIAALKRELPRVRICYGTIPEHKIR
jgi:hypothetical protein